MALVRGRQSYKHLRKLTTCRIYICGSVGGLGVSGIVSITRRGPCSCTCRRLRKCNGRTRNTCVSRGNCFALHVVCVSQRNLRTQNPLFFCRRCVQNSNKARPFIGHLHVRAQERLRAGAPPRTITPLKPLLIYFKKAHSPAAS